MLFGFLPAIIAGFLLTAIPNWTGRLPDQGTALLALLFHLACRTHCDRRFGGDRLAAGDGDRLRVRRRGGSRRSRARSSPERTGETWWLSRSSPCCSRPTPAFISRRTTREAPVTRSAPALRSFFCSSCSSAGASFRASRTTGSPRSLLAGRLPAFDARVDQVIVAIASRRALGVGDRTVVTLCRNRSVSRRLGAGRAPHPLGGMARLAQSSRTRAPRRLWLRSARLRTLGCCRIPSRRRLTLASASTLGPRARWAESSRGDDTRESWPSAVNCGRMWSQIVCT